eukprot:3932179-Rhodomonas_salina.1
MIFALSKGCASQSQFQVNSFATGSQDYSSVARISDTRFVVAWGVMAMGLGGPYDYYTQDYQTGVFAQLYNATGGRIGSEFQVNNYSVDAQYFPSVGAVGTDRFVIAWLSTNPEYDPNDIDAWDRQFHYRAQVFDVTGAKLGAEFQVNTDFYGQAWSPVVTGFGADRFLIQWVDPMATSVGQIFEGLGNKIGGEIELHYAASVAPIGSTGFVVSWVRNDTVLAQRYDASGIAIGEKFQVDNSNTTSNTEQNPYFFTITLAVDGGGFLVVWIKYETTPDFYNSGSPFPREVRSQLFDSAGERIGQESLCTADEAQGGQYTAASLGTHGFVFAWDERVWDDNNMELDPGSGVYAKMCRTSGGQVGETLLVEDNPQSQYAALPSLAVLSNSHFVVTWSRSMNSNVFAKIYQTPENFTATVEVSNKTLEEDNQNMSATNPQAPQPSVELDGVLLPPLPFLHCELPVTWGDIFGCKKPGLCPYKTGGLGRLMVKDEVEAWVCVEHACAGASADPRFCFVYHEQQALFIPWYVPLPSACLCWPYQLNLTRGHDFRRGTNQELRMIA